MTSELPPDLVEHAERLLHGTGITLDQALVAAADPASAATDPNGPAHALRAGWATHDTPTDPATDPAPEASTP